VPGDRSATGAPIFAKNSDRQRNEAQIVELHPTQGHLFGEQLKCTYIEIAQARETNAVLLCRPFWGWGAEMGANEHGVVIGNEGLTAFLPATTEAALTGMDLVRLGLERGQSAEQALAIIIDLLSEHGQGGDCGHLKPSFYNNGFLISDARSAYVLETVGRDWVWERVEIPHAISNVYSIEQSNHVSPRLEALLADRGTDENLPLSQRIADRSSQHIGQALRRSSRAASLLHNAGTDIDALAVMRILRDHGPAGPTDMSEDWSARVDARRTLCMHAGREEVHGQTTGSLVSEVRHGRALHWVTGTAAPCISLFRPAVVGVALPDHGRVPGDSYDRGSLWWRHARFHRQALRGDFEAIVEGVAPERNEIERRFSVAMSDVLAGGGPRDIATVIADCWLQADAALARWDASLPPISSWADTPYARAWDVMNRAAALDLS
jgi:hypothetical protein